MTAMIVDVTAITATMEMSASMRFRVHPATAQATADRRALFLATIAPVIATSAGQAIIASMKSLAAAYAAAMAGKLVLWHKTIVVVPVIVVGVAQIARTRFRALDGALARDHPQVSLLTRTVAVPATKALKAILARSRLHAMVIAMVMAL